MGGVAASFVWPNAGLAEKTTANDRTTKARIRERSKESTTTAYQAYKLRFRIENLLIASTLVYMARCAEQKQKGSEVLA
jgi:hypothetical protein